MEMKYVDDATPRRIDGWHSPILGMSTPIVSYGDRGRPLLIYPTAAADFLENERFLLIQALEPQINAGRIRVFCIESINRYCWVVDSLSVEEKARRQNLYSRYVEEEVVPYIRAVCGDPSVRLGVTGASFGGFHAGNQFFRRPDLFEALIGMSGFYDLGPDYLKGYSDDNAYYNNPGWFVAGLEGEYLDLLRNRCQIVIVTGQGKWEAPEESRSFSALLSNKGIPHTLDLWGHDVDHDWPWWRKMLPYYIDRLGW